MVEQQNAQEKPKVVNPIPNLQLVNQTRVSKTEFQKEAPILGVDYITEEEAKNWINPNAQKPRKHFRSWRVRFAKTLKRT